MPSNLQLISKISEYLTNKQDENYEYKTSSAKVLHKKIFSAPVIEGDLENGEHVVDIGCPKLTCRE